MGSDVSLLVLDSKLGAVVCDRWLGGKGTLETAVDVLDRPPQAPDVGLECWANVDPEAVRRIAQASYLNGATPEEVVALSERFPAPEYIWLIIRSF